MFGHSRTSICGEKLQSLICLKRNTPWLSEGLCRPAGWALWSEGHVEDQWAEHPTGLGGDIVDNLDAFLETLRSIFARDSEADHNLQILQGPMFFRLLIV